ncbi:DinB family protein [uncultured Roseobacter sp.]|uniref:DinB family protein n=1 Tax=uncultured Roseobacter sp. TaxID=114847 RepID=UPI00262BC87B|nr:DinB family protein [uncultured Roseobacter sp.]
MLIAFEKMAQNNAWANATLYRAAQALSEEDAGAEAPGFFPSLARTLNHIYEVDLYYIDALEEGGLGREVYQRDDEPSLASLARHQATADAQLIAFCENLTEETMKETRPTDRRDGVVEEMVRALLLHLFQHQIHHRGQAHVQLHALGIAPPQLDDFHLSFERAPSAKVYWS